MCQDRLTGSPSFPVWHVRTPSLTGPYKSLTRDSPLPPFSLETKTPRLRLRISYLVYLSSTTPGPRVPVPPKSSHSDEDSCRSDTRECGWRSTGGWGQRRVRGSLKWSRTSSLVLLQHEIPDHYLPLVQPVPRQVFISGRHHQSLYGRYCALWFLPVRFVMSPDATGSTTVWPGLPRHL